MRRRSRRSRRRRRRLLALACAAALALAAAWAWTCAGTSPDTAAENGTDVATSPVVEEAAASDQAGEEVETVTSGGLVVTGPEEFLGSEELAYLEEQVAELEEQDVNLGIVVLDLETGYSIEYNADERLYPASSIKAAYCAMVCEEYGGAGELSWALGECLVNSSNEAYELLRDTHGLDAFGDWLEDLGATEASAQAREYGYPDISAGELAEVWEEIFRFGTPGEDGSDELVDALAATNYTALGGLLRDEYEVWSKPGWYFQDSYDITSTNDAGVVFSDCGPYVVAVMTDLNGDLPGLLPLLDSLNAAHGAMCGGSTESQLSEETTIPGYVG